MADGNAPIKSTSTHNAASDLGSITSSAAESRIGRAMLCRKAHFEILITIFGGEKIMGQSTVYVSMPASSSLMKKLKADPALVSLVTALMCEKGEIYCFGDDIYGLDDDTLECIVEESEAPVEMGRAAEELPGELKQIETVHPGIRERIAYLEKTSSDIQAYLSRALAHEQGTVDASFIQDMLSGRETLSALDDWDELGLVPPDLVKEAAHILAPLDGTFSAVMESAAEEFARWRQLYLDAAANNEALLVRTR